MIRMDIGSHLFLSIQLLIHCERQVIMRFTDDTVVWHSYVQDEHETVDHSFLLSIPHVWVRQKGIEKISILSEKR